MTTSAKHKRVGLRPALAIIALLALASCEPPPPAATLRHPDVIQHPGAAKLPMKVAILLQPSQVMLQDHPSFFCKTDFDMPQQDINLIPVNANFAEDARLTFDQAFLSAAIARSIDDAKGSDAIFELSLQRLDEQPGCGFSTDRTDTINATIRALSGDGQERWRAALSSGTLTYSPPPTDSEADVLNVMARQSSHLMAQLLDAWVTQLRSTPPAGYAAVDPGVLTAAAAQGAAAEQSGDPRAALAAYTAALQKYPSAAGFNDDIVTRAIDVALRLNPPPAVPEEANRHVSAAEAALEAAKQKSDYETATREYYQALAIAPWWADAYADFATVLERLGRTVEAAKALTFYLRAAPNAPDRAATQAEIARLQAAGH